MSATGVLASAGPAEWTIIVLAVWIGIAMPIGIFVGTLIRRCRAEEGRCPLCGKREGICRHMA